MAWKQCIVTCDVIEIFKNDNIILKTFSGLSNDLSWIFVTGDNEKISIICIFNLNEYYYE